VLTVGDRQDAVVVKPRRPTPNHHVAMLERNTTRAIAPLRAAPQEDGWEPERHGNDRRAKIALVTITVQ